MLCLFECERLEDNPQQIMFGKGPEIAMFENIAPYVSLINTVFVSCEIDCFALVLDHMCWLHISENDFLMLVIIFGRFV